MKAAHESVGLVHATVMDVICLIVKRAPEKLRLFPAAE